MPVENKELNIDSSSERGLFILTWLVFWRCTKTPLSDYLPNNFGLEKNLYRSGKQSLSGLFSMVAASVALRLIDYIDLYCPATCRLNKRAR
jgi:hypothetical protein